MPALDHATKHEVHPHPVNGGILHRVPLGIVLAATFFLYFPVFSYQFVYDDIFQIVNNGHLDSWRYLPVYFTQHVWSHVPGVPANFYRPLFLVWLRLNNLAFGHQPTGWHLTTVLLHVLTTGLVYLLALRLIRRQTPALVAALIFGIHPVHAEAVAWVSGVTEPLGAVFFLGSLLCYLRWREATSRRRFWLGSSIGLFAAALLVKETAAVLPVLIAVWEWTLASEETRPSTFHRTRAQRWFLPFWLVLAAYLAARTVALHGFTRQMTPVPLGRSLLEWPWLLCLYIRLLVWPAHLSALYNPPDPSLAALVLAGAGCCLAALAAWHFRKRYSSRRAGFLAAWFLLTIAPALVIFCVALPDEAFHDRYLYLPSVALALAAGLAADTAWNRSHGLGKISVIGVLGIVSLALGRTTYRQIQFWSSNYDLFQRAASEAPGNEIAELNFAAELVKRSEYTRALQVAQRVVSLYPQSARGWAMAGAAAFYLHDFRDAEHNYARAASADPNRGDVLYYLGLSRMKLGAYSSARDALLRAVDLAPGLRGIHGALGCAEARSGQETQAHEEFQEELRLQNEAGLRPCGSNNSRCQMSPSGLSDADALRLFCP